MNGITVGSLESLSSKIESIIGTMSLLLSGIGDNTATRQEIAGCATLVLSAVTDCKSDLDSFISKTLNSELPG